MSLPAGSSSRTPPRWTSCGRGLMSLRDGRSSRICRRWTSCALGWTILPAGWSSRIPPRWRSCALGSMSLRAGWSSRIYRRSTTCGRGSMSLPAGCSSRTLRRSTRCRRASSGCRSWRQRPCLTRWLLRSRRALPSSSRLLRGCRQKIFAPTCSAWPRARSSSASRSCRCSPPASMRLPRRFRRSTTAGAPLARRRARGPPDGRSRTASARRRAVDPPRRPRPRLEPAVANIQSSLAGLDSARAEDAAATGARLADLTDAVDSLAGLESRLRTSFDRKLTGHAEEFTSRLDGAESRLDALVSLDERVAALALELEQRPDGEALAGVAAELRAELAVLAARPVFADPADRLEELSRRIEGTADGGRERIDGVAEELNVRVSQLAEELGHRLDGLGERANGLVSRDEANTAAADHADLGAERARGTS